MKNRVSIFIIIFYISIPAIAQTAEKFSFESSVGYHRIPGVLFSIDKSITKHPDSFSGIYKSFGGAYSLNDKWSLGLTYVGIHSTGNGQWGRTSMEEEFKKNGVDGIVTGRTDISIKGFAVNLKRTFRNGSKIRPFFQISGGLGWLDVKFDGKFIGHETESGMNLPVVEDASDSIQRKIPLVGFEAGVQFNLGKHLVISAAPYWNTGFGSKLGASIIF